MRPDDFPIEYDRIPAEDNALGELRPSGADSGGLASYSPSASPHDVRAPGPLNNDAQSDGTEDERLGLPAMGWSGAPADFDWRNAWSFAAKSVGLRDKDPVIVALSGGADSVFLLHLVARSEPRPRIVAVHVDHGLRPDESLEDAAFCARLCARLQVPFVRRTLELDAESSNLEAIAREERYRVLTEEARQARIEFILTGHHEDDALETLLIRWMRGTTLSGLGGLRERNVMKSRVLDSNRRSTKGGTLGLGSSEALRPVTVVRPLLSMRRENAREILAAHELPWREDSSNLDPRFTRNRVRNDLLPQVRDTCGPAGVENLRAFARAVEGLEDELASRTAHLDWSAPSWAGLRGATEESLGELQAGTPESRHLSLSSEGGSLLRADLEKLAPPLKRRALWRLLTEATGHSPSKHLLEMISQDVSQGICTRHSLPAGWLLQLRSRELHLLPPGAPLVPEDECAPPPEGTADPLIGSPNPAGSSVEQDARPVPHANAFLDLPIPGEVQLADGRSVRAEWVFSESSRGGPARSIPSGPCEVELDGADLPAHLLLRFPKPGDRFRGIGAPGSKALSRFLSDAGIPREQRSSVPLVFAGEELIWVAGVRPCEARRVQNETHRRLRLVLLAPR